MCAIELIGLRKHFPEDVKGLEKTCESRRVTDSIRRDGIGKGDIDGKYIR